MKIRMLAFVLIFAGNSGIGLYRAAAEMEVSVGVSISASSDFYEPLTSSGSWVEVGGYGRCWHPAGVTAGWRPYCHGNWEWTDCGWYWVSAEPWAWACYHYGTWVENSNDGWVWVPGVEWAPAWVYWRTGGDYIGWAPCGPSGVRVEPGAYMFVENRHFHDQIRPDVVVINNITIINRTTEIRNVSREQRQIDGRSQSVMVNNGPGVSEVEKATGHKFAVVPVQKMYQTTARTVPENLRHGPAREVTHPESTHPETTHSEPQHTPPAQTQSAPGGNLETPRHLPPNQDMPLEKKLPAEKPADKTTPTLPPARTLPQPAPSDRKLPPGNKELPLEKGQHPAKELIPPGQQPHPKTTEVPPANPPVRDPGGDKDRHSDSVNH